MLLEKVKQELDQEEKTPLHEELLEHCLRLISPSRREMERHFDDWDFYEDVYRGRINQTDADKKAKERGEVSRTIDPLTQSQVDTAVSLFYNMLTQRKRFFELEAIGPEDYNKARIMEALLANDVQYNNFKGSVLIQALRSYIKRGLCVFKVHWHKESYWEEQPEEQEILDQVAELFGEEAGEPTMKVKEMIRFLGNKVVNQSPYRFIPDTRVPLSRFQEGEFCASECEYTINTLRRMDFEGRYAGTKHIKDKNLSQRNWQGAYGGRRVSFRNKLESARQEQTRGNRLDDTPILPIVVTEIQLDLIPSEYHLEDGVALGDEDYPVKYVIEIANDERIIGIQKLGHPWFTYDVAQYNESEDDYIGTGLAYILHHLQEAITWFYNARFSNVRKVIGNKLIVDPRAVNMADFENRSPIIKIKAAYSNQDIRTFVHQLQLTDVTVNHVQDANILRGIAKEATGITDTLMGQYSVGRRSATQDQNVSNNAFARVKVHIDALWETALRPLAEKMIFNHRNFLDVPQLVKVEGLRTFDENGRVTISGQEMISATKEQILGSFDITVYDGTLPSEKAFIAQQQQQIIPMFFGPPEQVQMMIQLTGLDPRKLITDYFRNIGMTNVESLYMGIEEKQAMMRQLLQQQKLQQNVSQTRQSSVSPKQPGVQSSGGGNAGTSTNGSGEAVQSSQFNNGGGSLLSSFVQGLNGVQSGTP